MNILSCLLLSVGFIKISVAFQFLDAVDLAMEKHPACKNTAPVISRGFLHDH